MATVIIKTCGLCDKPLHGSRGLMSERVAPCNGLSIEIGYSLGGWGHRKDHISRFSDEVCIPCYERCMPHVKALKKAMRPDKEDNTSSALRKALGRGN